MPKEERVQEKDQIKNNLGEALGEFDLEEDVRTKITEKLVGLGFKDKEAVDRTSRQSRAKGLEAGEAGVRGEVDSLKSQLGEIVGLLKGKSEETEEIPETKGDKDIDPSFLELQKNQKELLKQFQALNARITEKDAQVDSLKKENLQKEIKSRMTNLLTESGFEQVPDLLTLIDARADFKLDPEAIDGDGILVFQKGTDKYFGGEELPVTGREFLEKFKASDTAKRFLSVSGSATGASEFQGGTIFPGRGEGPLSHDALKKSLQKLGIGV